MKLVDTHMLITGGTAGIGLALARKAEERGARVTVCGRSRERLDEARSVLSESACAVSCDVSDGEQHAALFEEARAAHGPIDVLVNNAGVQQLMDFTDPTQQRQIALEAAVNFTAPMLLTEAALPQLLERPSAAVVNVTSGLALSPKASSPVYCATKAGVRSFSRALRWQLEDTNVHVVEVLPPLVDTEMTEGRGRGKITPEQVAAETLRGLARGRDEVYVGKTKLLRFVRMLSEWLAGRITRRM